RRTHRGSHAAGVAVTDFPIENLPYGVFRHNGGERTIGVAIEDRVLDLRRARAAGLLDGLPAETRESCTSVRLNELMSLGRPLWRDRRAYLTDLLTAPRAAATFLLPIEDVVMQLPAEIGDYTDFYASIHHATNVGRLFRPDNPLLQNYKWVP